MTIAIEVDNARLVYAAAGSPYPQAPTLVLVHGFPLSRAMWQAQLEGLSPRCRVVAPDLRGYGESSFGDWPAAGETPSLDRYADDLEALIASLQADGPVVLVGFSMGGYIALNMARRCPDAFDALVLMDTRAAADDDTARATRLKMADHIHEWGAARVAELMRPKLFAMDTPERIVQETVAVISATDPAAIAASQLAMAARPDSTGLLGSIAKPTLVVVGEHDAISPSAEMRGIAAAIPGARFVEVPGVGHMAPVEAPEAVNAALAEFAESL
ncbi:alpha/beta fold hydrolase [Botrimarina mediterranea]|uniref:AB hydrolase superfamily protein YdjP n=1 Tax=Botrimarina mediterranea TaxID=2528022 RepID=A0A518KDT4_9BACT|nr:alpha/beta hydrolase [Botrimarina mediterranea]QDV75958.1 AB hydrolase superfamily protein YdjP [Botrimarina mediterranea]QDV80553.1 AB hydrolase superfamily protein YdjP [Planctomycetes bacterium K2D]